MNLEAQISWPPLGEPRSANFVAGAALCEPRIADFVGEAGRRQKKEETRPSKAPWRRFTQPPSNVAQPSP